MRVLSLLASLKRTSSGRSHSSVVASVESSDEDVVEVSLDRDITGKKVADRPFDPQIYKSEKIWTNILQVDEARSSLCVVLKKHEDSLLKVLQASKYQYGAGSMAVANSVSGKSDAVNVDGMLEHRGK